MTKDNQPKSDGISKQARPRWRLRFSLATLLIIVTLFGIWLGFQADRAHRQRIAVAAIEKAGGAAFYDYEYDDQEYLKFPATKPREFGLLDRLMGPDYFRQVVRIELANANNDALRSLDSLSDVRIAFLADNHGITDGGLVHLKKCSKLRVLNLSGTGVCGHGLTHLTELRELRSLVLNGTPLDDEGARHLKALTNLEYLWLDDTDVTDEGLSHLQHMTHLRELSLVSTKATPRAIDRLQLLLPLCKICR